MIVFHRQARRPAEADGVACTVLVRVGPRDDVRRSYVSSAPVTDMMKMTMPWPIRRPRDDTRTGTLCEESARGHTAQRRTRLWSTQL